MSSSKVSSDEEVFEIALEELKRLEQLNAFVYEELYWLMTIRVFTSLEGVSASRAFNFIYRNIDPVKHIDGDSLQLLINK